MHITKHKPQNAESLIIDGYQIELDKIVRLDAQRMLQAALEAEGADYVALHKDLVNREGRTTVTRNGRMNERGVLSGAGDLRIRQTRVRGRRAGPYANWQTSSSLDS